MGRSRTTNPIRRSRGSKLSDSGSSETAGRNSRHRTKSGEFTPRVESDSHFDPRETTTYPAKHVEGLRKRRISVDRDLQLNANRSALGYRRVAREHLEKETNVVFSRERNQRLEAQRPVCRRSREHRATGLDPGGVDGNREGKGEGRGRARGQRWELKRRLGQLGRWELRLLVLNVDCVFGAVRVLRDRAKGTAVRLDRGRFLLEVLRARTLQETLQRVLKNSWRRISQVRGGVGGGLRHGLDLK